MLASISPDKAIFLDKLIKTTKADYIIFEIDSIVQMTLITADLSQMTIIKLEQSFFEQFTSNARLTVSTSIKKFYELNMKALKLEITESTITFEYLMSEICFKRSYYCLSPDIFDLDFYASFSCNFDMANIKRIVGMIKDKEIKIKIEQNNSQNKNENNNQKSDSEYNNDDNNQKSDSNDNNYNNDNYNNYNNININNINLNKTVKFLGKTIEIEMKIEIIHNSLVNNNFEFLVDSEKLKSTLYIADLFYETAMNISEDLTPVNFIYKLPDVFFSTFISTE